MNNDINRITRIDDSLGLVSTTEELLALAKADAERNLKDQGTEVRDELYKHYEKRLSQLVDYADFEALCGNLKDAMTVEGSK